MRQSVYLGRDWQNLNYLARGNPEQKRAWTALGMTKIPSNLEAFQPTLIGTLPLGFDLAVHELYFCCQTPELERFQKKATKAFGTRKKFRFVENWDSPQGPQSECFFEIEGFHIKIVATESPLKSQQGYLAFLTIAKLLDLGRSKLHSKIQEHLNNGLDLMTASGQCIGIKSNYQQNLAHLALLGITYAVEKSALAFRS